MEGWSEEEKGEEILFYFFFTSSIHSITIFVFFPSSAHTEKDIMRQVYLASFFMKWVAG